MSQEKKYDKGFEARKLIKSFNFGVLATNSLDLEGYPFGSVVSYCLSDTLEPLMLLSTLAQHTKNLTKDNKVSLTVFDSSLPDIQAKARLTYIGEVLVTENEKDKLKYQTYFPNAKDYFEFGDFKLYKIQLKKIRFIEGFGKIFWVEPTEFFLENPLLPVETRIINHMNQDHENSIIDYCNWFKKLVVTKAKLVGMDAEGFDVLAGEDFIYQRFNLSKNIINAESARNALVQLAKNDTSEISVL